MRAALVLNGDPPTLGELAVLDGCDVIMCADGGALVVAAAGRTPTHVVGDLDSLDASVVAALQERGCAVERHAVDKDATDGELAVDRLLAIGATDVTLLGGHGGRTAMFLGALKLLRRLHEAGCTARMVGGGETVRVATPGRGWRGGAAGDTLDVVPIDADARLSISGCAWSGAVTLARRGSRGVSNHILGPATVDVLEGTVLVIHTKPPTP